MFYTHFSNKIIPDYSVDSQISYSNLDGYGISRGIALNAKVLFNFPLTLNVGATFIDVYSFEVNSAVTCKVQGRDNVFFLVFGEILSHADHHTHKHF